MSKSPSSEKMIEILFMCYVFQSFELGEITLYAPSTRKEFEIGYDVSLTQSGFRELYLQFKSPEVVVNQKEMKFTIRLHKRQHARLLEYPPYSAFYVSHVLKDGLEIQDEQQKTKNAKQFLGSYIAIDAHGIPSGATLANYTRRGFDKKSPQNPKHNWSIGGFDSNDKTIENDRWFTGLSLIDGFKQNRLGHSIGESETFEIEEFLPSPQNMMKGRIAMDSSLDIYDDEDGNLGVMLRKPN